VVSNAFGTATSQAATLIVTKGTPVLSWNTPAPSLYGTALDTNQLNASITPSVPGRLDYSPTNGAVLGAGTNVLSVVFTPTDSADYNAVTGSVSVVVLRAPLRVTATNATRPYGQPNPPLGGTITGLQNGDPITANYTCSATPSSPAGTNYPIVPSLVDVNNLQTNYHVTLVNGTLTIAPPPPPTITAVAPNAGPTSGGRCRDIPACRSCRRPPPRRGRHGNPRRMAHGAWPDRRWPCSAPRRA